MRPIALRLGISLGLFAAAISASALELTDATGTHVSVPDHPRRIVTLIPSLGELAADLSGQDLSRIVGVSEYTDYPPALEKVAQIGPYHRFSIEKVVSLKPDLVLASLDGNARDQVLHLRELGLSVLVVDANSFKKIEESVRLVAQAMGEAETGVEMSRALHEGFEKVRAEAATHAHPRVLLQLGDDPLVVVGGGSFLNEAIKLVGGENLYADSSTHYPKPAREDVIRRAPDAIIVMALDRKNLPLFERYASEWGRYSALAAVKNRKVRVLVADSLLRPSLRLLEGLALLRKAVFE